ncbi:MAG: hypothetical protein LBG80_12530 [Bacteroidales bacterium]|jgi:hypothetical protein|nr:hypothetical protein [Bacteroidales bacterium]
MFIEKGVAEHDANFYDQLDRRMLELRNLVAKNDYTQIADAVKFINDNLVNTPEAFVTYTKQLIYIIYSDNTLKDIKILSLCMNILHKAVDINVDSFPYRMGEQIDILAGEKEIVKRNNDMMKKFMSLRKNKCEKMLCIWNKIVSNIDDDWDDEIASQAFFKVKIPWESIKAIGLSGPTGVVFPPAECVDDELLRKKYQAELDEAKKQTKRAKIQKVAKKVRQEKKNIVKSFLIDLYSNKPLVTEELETLLKEYNIDEEFSKEILDAVKKTGKNK